MSQFLCPRLMIKTSYELILTDNLIVTYRTNILNTAEHTVFKCHEYKQIDCKLTFRYIGYCQKLCPKTPKIDLRVLEVSASDLFVFVITSSTLAFHFSKMRTTLLELYLFLIEIVFNLPLSLKV